MPDRLSPSGRGNTASPGRIDHVIEVGSTNVHRMEILPDGSKLYAENEEDGFALVIDLQARRQTGTIPAPGGLAGIGLSPDDKTVVLVDGQTPQIPVMNTETDAVVATIPLEGHSVPAQVARYSPDGRYLVVTSVDAPLATIFDADLSRQRLLRHGDGPMNMAFAPDGQTVVIANQNGGTLAVCDLERAEVLRTVPAGVGVEALGLF